MTTQQPQFDPHEFLQLAAQLSQATTQGELRSAVSRAYYATFLRAREVLAANNSISPTNTGQDHGIVIQALRSRNRAEGNQLDRLRVQRGRSDYNLNVSLSQAEAAQAIQVARSLWNRL